MWKKLQGGKKITEAIIIARKKGLNVRQNRLVEGWSVSLPSGESYHAKSTADMIKYVRGY